MKKILALLAFTLLAACENAPGNFTPQPLDFGGRQPIRVNVAEVKVNETYQPTLTAPNVDQTFPLPPDAALKIWATQRLNAAGTQGTLEFIIDDANVTETKLPKTKGVKGLFTDDQDARYDLRVHVTMRLYNGTDSMSVASGDVTILRSKTINEKSTVDDRTRLFDSMTKEMIASFDQQATARLNQYFAAYLR